MRVLSTFLADASDTIKSGANAACAGSGCNTGLTVELLFRNVTNTLIFVIGALAVIFIIVGAMRYVISRGDSAQVTAAKNTLIYAVGGLVVAIAAFAIVNFVVTNVSKNTTNTANTTTP